MGGQDRPDGRGAESYARKRQYDYAAVRACMCQWRWESQRCCMLRCLPIRLRPHDPRPHYLPSTW